MSAIKHTDLRIGDFRLTKWVSNSKGIIESIPEEEQAQGVRNVTFDDILAVELALEIC